MKVVELWAEAQGCAELASDTNIANSQSQALHVSLGFAETQRVVYFRKLLPTAEYRVFKPATSPAVYPPRHPKSACAFRQRQTAQ